MRKLVLFVMACAGMTLIGAPAHLVRAASIETLVMPGPVSEAHAEYETECSNCHAPFRKASQTQLCLDCHEHENIRADIEMNQGYHGRIEDIRTVECKTCHTEHKGRGEDIIRLDPERFDHRLTDFVLKGAHLNATCDGCHKADEKYWEAPRECIDCHEQDDAHKGRLGKACADCHTESAWGEGKFDHDATDFPLEGHHEEIACDSCHPNERYENTPMACVSCHAINDAHAGRYGEKCETCHTPRDWDISLFDHDRETDFPLEFKHEQVLCDSCHTGPLYEEELDTACYGCHKNDDEHQGRLGRDCGDCHSPRGWSRSAFDHDQETDFPLRDKHEKLECHACHKGSAYDEQLDTGCASCHRADDVHRGQEGEQCEQCHNESGWGAKVFFDHDLTRFPLIGLHATAPCEECHMGGTFKDAQLDCVECHEADDVHEAKLGPACEQCHNPNGWALWEFDHNTQTDFVLDGAHEGLECLACHTVPVRRNIRQSRVCASCHMQDDVHRGQYGRVCDRCHTTEEFAPATLMR